jgi:hypothetical protein
MSPTYLSNYVSGREPARNSNGSGWPEIQTIHAFSSLDRVGPGRATRMYTYNLERWPNGSPGPAR